MATYDNCYNIIAEVRRDVDEYSEALVQGADTEAWDNEYITQKINLAQIYLYNLIFKRMKHHFRVKVDLTGVDSVFTLPANFGAIEWFKNDNGYQVYPMEPKDISPSGTSKRHYYRKGNTLILDKSGCTDTYTLFYRWKPRKIFSGKSTAGAATSITFPTTASKVIDFYNDMLIENITQDWVDTISDYTTGRVATITETAAKDDYFGIVSELPEPFHHLIAPRASMLLRSSSPLAQNPVSNQENQLFNEDLLETLMAYAGSGEDVDMMEVFTDFDTGGYPGGIVAT